jgi:rhamnose transport system permease protein
VLSGLLFAAHWHWGLVLLASAGCGLFLGACNGFLVAVLGLPSIVVTLATMMAWREALRWKGQGQFINLPSQVQWFGLTQGVGQMAIIAVAVAIFVVCVWAARNLAAGRFVYAIGSNAEARTPRRLEAATDHLSLFRVPWRAHRGGRPA